MIGAALDTGRTLDQYPKVGPHLCQLAVPYDPRFFPAGGAIVERKHDGLRGFWVDGQLLTRNGLPMWMTAHLWPALARLQRAFGRPMVFDGEYVEPGGFAATARRYNLTRGATGPQEGHGTLHLFDAMPETVWRNGERGDRLLERKALLANMMAAAGPLPGLALVPHQRAATPAHVAALAAAAVTAGHEGVVVKDPASLHYAGRGRAWQKIKGKLTLYLAVTGFGMSGPRLAYVVVDHGGRLNRIAAGFTDRQRLLYGQAPAETVVGRIAEIECMEVADTGLLRQAVFKGWRDDLVNAVGARGRTDA